MDTKEFKKQFNKLALENGFSGDYGAWFKESDECILALILRKSSYSRLYYLRIKVNLKEAFGKTFIKEKEWIKHDVAHFLLGPDKKFLDIFDLENELTDFIRIEKLENLFMTNINELTNKILTRNGIIELYQTGYMYILPAVKEELGIK